MCAVVIAGWAEIPVLAVNGTVQAPQPIAMGLLNLLQLLCARWHCTALEVLQIIRVLFCQCAALTGMK